MIGLHRLGHLVPPGRVQRRGRRPAADHGVRVAGGVLKLVDGPGDGRVEFRERVHVRVEGVGVHDVEGARVDLVHAEARVEVRERRHRRPDPAGRERVRRVLHRAVERVVDHELVFMRVAEEDVGDDVGRVAGDDLVEIVGRVGDRVRPVPARQDVAEDPDALAFVFGVLQLADHPGQVARVVRVSGVDVVEVVGAVPEIRIQGNDP